MYNMSFAVSDIASIQVTALNTSIPLVLEFADGEQFSFLNDNNEVVFSIAYDAINGAYNYYDNNGDLNAGPVPDFAAPQLTLNPALPSEVATFSANGSTMTIDETSLAAMVTALPSLSGIPLGGVAAGTVLAMDSITYSVDAIQHTEDVSENLYLRETDRTVQVLQAFHASDYVEFTMTLADFVDDISFSGNNDATDTNIFKYTATNLPAYQKINLTGDTKSYTLLLDDFINVDNGDSNVTEVVYSGNNTTAGSAPNGLDASQNFSVTVNADAAKISYSLASNAITATKRDNILAADAIAWTNAVVPAADAADSLVSTALNPADGHSGLLDVSASVTAMAISDTAITSAVHELLDSEVDGSGNSLADTTDLAEIRAALKLKLSVFEGLKSDDSQQVSVTVDLQSATYSNVFTWTVKPQVRFT